MNKMRRLILVVLALCFFCVGLQAQEDADPYAGVLKSRTPDGAFVLGEPSARVKLIEFSDFLCTSCQNYEPLIHSFILDYVVTGQAQFEYRMFPVIDPELSVLSAGLVECADTLQPGAFWRARDLMFEAVSADGFTSESVAGFAAELGLAQAELETCSGAARQAAVDAEYGASLGVSGTPTLFVQYGDEEPIEIALALPEHFAAIVNAIRPASSEPSTIAHGKYAGMQTWRRPDGGFVLGEPAAPVTIVAFEDFLCGHCQAYLSTVHLFIEQYVQAGLAQFEYRFYPLVNPQFSTHTAKIAECVAAQDLGSFWDAHDLLYEFASVGNLGDLETTVANLLNLDAAALAACTERSMQFLIDTQLGQSTGVNGTPAVRARAANGPLQLIFADGQPLDRGGAPLEVLGALLAGADNVTIGAPERSLLNDGYLEETSLVSGDPCGPPCWQNIVPGGTSLAEAAAIVAALDGITILQSDERGLLFGRDDGPPCCQIASGDGQSVASILLQFAPKIGIGEVIATHGEPPFVSGQLVSDVEAALSLYYPESQMLLYVLTPGVDGLLEETSPVVSAIYATDALLTSAFASVSFDYWKGYLSYSDYMDGEFDYVP